MLSTTVPVARTPSRRRRELADSVRIALNSDHRTPTRTTAANSVMAASTSVVTARS